MMRGWAAIWFAGVLTAGCGDGSNVEDMSPADLSASLCTNPGGPAMGAPDTHCQADGGLIMQSVSQAACHPDLGGADLGDVAVGAYGATMYNTSGYDDDCKYHVSYGVTPICQGAPAYFTVSATINQSSGGPLTDAHAIVEVYNNATLLPANSQGMTTVESPPGTYKIGPVVFDGAGLWVVRFHFNEMCDDTLDDSPHGHAAFYLNVP